MILHVVAAFTRQRGAENEKTTTTLVNEIVWGTVVWSWSVESVQLAARVCSGTTGSVFFFNETKGHGGKHNILFIQTI